MRDGNRWTKPGPPAGSLSKEYIYAGSQLLATVAGSSVTYNHPDHLSTRAQTDGSGNVVSASGTLPYGDAWYASGSSTKWTFTSYERDAASGESGLDFAQNRYYASRQGRFVSADALGGHLGVPQSLNRYTYVRNDPVNRVDRFGLDDDCPLCIIAKFVPGVAFIEDPGPGLDCPPFATCEAGGPDDLGPFGPPQPIIDKVPDAVNKAVDALKNPKCADAIGQGLLPDGGGVVSASEVLHDLSSNVHLQDDGAPSGFQIIFADMSSPPGTTISATTSVVSYTSGFAGNVGPTLWKVTITINTAAGFFVNGSLVDQAVTLLHELGHVMAGLYGADASAIKKDDELTPGGRDQSAKNTKTVRDKCFPKGK